MKFKQILKQAVRLPFLPVILAPFILLSPVFLTGKALFWGTPVLQFVPWWHWAWATLRAGHLPLWNPLVGMGAPLLANYQTALFYPPNWLYFLADTLAGAAGIAWLMAPVVALHLAWAGTGMVILARRLGLGMLAQTVSGLAFGLCGYLVARAGFLSINAAAAWVPWILLASWQVVESRRSFKPVVILGLMFGMQLLAGHAQTAWYALLLAGMWVGYWGWHAADSQQITGAEEHSWRLQLRGVVRSLGRLALALGIAAGLSAVQLLPTVEYLLQSQRSSAVNYELAMTYSFWPWHFLTLLAPGLFGNPAHGDYWGYANYWEDAIYIGLLPFLLAITATSRKKKSHPDWSSLTWFLAILSLLSFLLALGKNTPVFPWLYSHVPTFSMFQAPARYLIWPEFALSLLAGIGAESWRRPEGRALYWTRLATAGAFSVTLGAGLAWYIMGDVSPTFIQATALAGLWGIGAGVLSLLAPVADSAKQGRSLNGWTWAVVLLVAADLLVAGWGLNPGVSLALYRQPSPLAVQVRSQSGGRRLYLPQDDEETLKFKRFFLFKSFDPGEDWVNVRAVLLPNLNMLDGVTSVNNFDPMLPGRYARWMEALGGVDAKLRQQLLNLMGVGVVEKVDKRMPFGVNFTPSSSEQSHEPAAARLRWVPCALEAQDAQDAWTQVMSGKLDFQSEVVLEGEAALSPSNCQKAAGAELNWIAQTPNRLQIRLSAQSPGWLVLSDVWYPGWQAQVDGRSTPVLKADYLFRAVQVGAGEHVVTFIYRPRSFWLGLVLSLVSWSILIGALLVQARNSRIMRPSR